MNRRLNPKNNAISRLAYAAAGGFRRYRTLPRAERVAYRAIATRQYERGLRYSKVAEEIEAEVRQGYVYAMVHPRDPEYVKIGRADDPESRLRGYQTGCSQRAYRMLHYVYTDDAVALEKEIHDALSLYKAPHSREWFRITHAQAVSVLDDHSTNAKVPT